MTTGIGNNPKINIGQYRQQLILVSISQYPTPVQVCDI